MPAGLLLSPTARTVRSGPGREPSRRRWPPAAGPLASPAGTTSGPFGEGPVGAVPFSVTRRPSSGLRLRRFPLIPAPEPPYPAPIPGKVVGAKARPQDTPSPPGSRYGFPPLPGETRILPALPPLTGVSLPASSCAPCRKRSSPCFSPAGPPSQRCVRPAPSRPEDCALNQHFSSHPGTFVQRKMIL